MSVIGSNILAGASGQAAGGYNVERSLRFNSSDSAFCGRTVSSAGDRRTFTFSTWVKRSVLGTVQSLFSVVNAATQERLMFNTDNKLYWVYAQGAASRSTDAVYRDASAWYHIVWVSDTNNGTATERIRFYVNGIQQSTSGSTVSSGQQWDVNNTVAHRIGNFNDGGSDSLFFNGYLADIHFIDGQALTPSSFGEYDANNVWQPKAYTGSYGTNGFQLKFADNSNNTATTLGKDTSGNGNNWTPNNLSVLAGGPTSVASASGALPILNTSDTYGEVASGGIRSDSFASNIQLCVPFNSGSTTDVSPTGRTSSTRTGTVSNVSSTTTSSKFYGSSARFASGSINYGIVAAAAVNSSNNHTFEGWFRLDNVAANSPLFCHYNYEDGWVEQGWVIRVNSTRLTVRNGTAGTELTSRVLSSNTWYHFAVTFNGLACKMYLDGELQASTSNFGTPGVTNNRFVVGGVFYYGSVQSPITGYLQDFRWYDYVKYTTSFNPPSATVNTAIAAGNDSLVDSPTNYGTDTGAGGTVRGNYATINPLSKAANATLSNGNLDVTNTISGSAGCASTIGMPSGKWYCEVTVNAVGSETKIGICKENAIQSEAGSVANSWAYGNNGEKFNTNVNTSYGNSFTTGDVIGIAFDADAGSLFFYKNGTVQNSGTAAFTGLISGPYFYQFTARAVGSSNNLSVNFGQRPFAYTAPSGFKALCTANLPTPTIANGATAMDVKLYTGNGSTQTISGLNFSPDFVWIKGRSTGYSHMLFDTIRGATNYLYSNNTNAEAADNQTLTAFTSDGFSLGNNIVPNQNSATHVAWAWDAGSSTVTNTQGSITSQVRANASAGFSVITYTGTGANASVGHGLGVAPSLIIIKARTQATARNWAVYHSSIGATKILELSTTNAAQTVNFWQDTAPTSSVFTLSSQGDVNANTYNYVAYCFAPVAGYSSFGSYTGNGSSDGPFVFTGMRPRWILFKRYDSSNGWVILDAVRNSYNYVDSYLEPNTSSAEFSGGASGACDFLSNGFKVRSTGTGLNASGGSYIYFAVAESPFAYARAR